jgi:hypothetical protein
VVLEAEVMQEVQQGLIIMVVQQVLAVQEDKVNHIQMEQQTVEAVVVEMVEEMETQMHLMVQVDLV